MICGSLVNRHKLRYWAKSLSLNAKLVPLSGLATIIMGLYDYFKLGDSYFLYGSLCLICTPLFMSILGKVPQTNKKLVRIDKRYEPYENMSADDEKESLAGMQKWTKFHRMRCVLALSAFVFFYMGHSNAMNVLLASVK